MQPVERGGPGVFLTSGQEPKWLKVMSGLLLGTGLCRKPGPREMDGKHKTEGSKHQPAAAVSPAGNAREKGRKGLG